MASYLSRRSIEGSAQSKAGNNISKAANMRMLDFQSGQAGPAGLPAMADPAIETASRPHSYDRRPDERELH